MDVANAPRGFFAHFAGIDDPRVEKTRQHALIDILAIALLSVICGADGWTDIELFGRAREAWLRTFLSLATPRAAGPVPGGLAQGGTARIRRHGRGRPG
jgi:hypothetical protein